MGLDKTALFLTKDSILSSLTTELKTVDRNVTEISIKDEIPKFSAKEKIEIDYITTISAVPTELKTLDEKVIEASVEDKMSTKIMFTDLRSDDIPLSTESIMGVDKLFTTDSIELDKTTEKIITKFPSSGIYFSTDSIAEIPSISTDLKTLDTNVTEDSNKLDMSTKKLLTDSYVDDASFSIKVISDADEINIFPTNKSVNNFFVDISN